MWTRLAFGMLIAITLWTGAKPGLVHAWPALLDETEPAETVEVTDLEAADEDASAGDAEESGDAEENTEVVVADEEAANAPEPEPEAADAPLPAEGSDDANESGDVEPGNIESDSTESEAGEAMESEEPAELESDEKPAHELDAENDEKLKPLAPDGASPEQMLNRAFEMSQQVATLEEATAMIELCEAALLVRPVTKYSDYGKQLMSWAYNKRGELQADAGENEQALVDFERAITLDATRWKALHNRAVSLAMLHRYDEAMIDFDETIKLKPNYANAYYNRGELHYDRGNFPSAIDDYSSAIRFAPRDSEAYNSRGHAFYKQGDLTRAISDYDRAIQFDAANAAAYVNRGDAFAETGQYGRAAADYRNAIRIAPELGRAYQSSGWLMATAPDERIRHPQFALDAARRAIELDGESFRYLDTLAAALANSGDYDSARKAETRAIELAPPETAEAYKARLALYENDEPYRDRPSAPAQNTIRSGTQTTRRPR